MGFGAAYHDFILTNTNQQHYSGQAQPSYLSQMVALSFADHHADDGARNGVQQYEHYFINNPMCFLKPISKPALSIKCSKLMSANWADDSSDIPLFDSFMHGRPLLLTSQGVPSTFQGGPEVQVIDQSSELTAQKIPLGPVAPMVAIKQLGSNGGGWYGPNSSVPLENPTPLSNLEMLAILLIPVSVIFMLGFFTKRAKFAGFVCFDAADVDHFRSQRYLVRKPFIDVNIAFSHGR